MKKLLILLFFLQCLNSQSFGQQTIGYQNPPKEIADIINAKGQPSISLDPTNNLFLYLEKESIFPLRNSLNEQEVRIAGARLNPDNNFPSRLNPATSMKLKRANEDTASMFVQDLPNKPAFAFAKWSPDGQKIAFCQINKKNVELWIVEVKTLKAKKVFDNALNIPIDYNPIVWMPDSEHILCLMILKNRGVLPEKEVEVGPSIQENDGKVRASITYQDLLKDKYDESVFDYYLTSELVKVNINDGTFNKITDKSIFMSFESSPDGEYILVKHITRPYSYKVNVLSFPSIVEIRTKNGILVKKLADLPVVEKLSGRDAATISPRNHAWRLDTPATLYWIQALDEGNPEKKVNFRDKIVQLEAPFTNEEKLFYQTKNRFNEIYWGNNTNAIIVERWWKVRKMQWVHINPSTVSEIDTVANFSFDNSYDSPGEPFQENNMYGRKTLKINNDKCIFLSGYAYSDKDGILPTLSKFNLKTKEKEQIWQSQPPYIESFVTFNGQKNDKIIVVRQSKTEPNNYANIDLESKSLTPITFQKSELLGLNTIQKRDLKYTRNDGIELNATLYFPSNYDSTSGPLPTLLWAYPSEYKSKESAGKNYSSPYYFIGYYSTQMLLASQGYAVIDNASFPIIGEGKNEPNDTYLEQIYQNAKAAINEGVRLRIVDSSKVAIAGHSYGAFMAANLLTHTNLFKTGIAESGAYNRTLTPYGFQSEYRSYWQIPEVYNKISPFQNANKLKFPILLIHGDADNNPGTFTLQSERYFDALRGQGANVRFVKLPYESHVYQAKESILHVSWEVFTWLEKNLKISKGDIHNNTGK